MPKIKRSDYIPDRYIPTVEKETRRNEERWGNRHFVNIAMDNMILFDSWWEFRFMNWSHYIRFFSRRKRTWLASAKEEHSGRRVRRKSFVRPRIYMVYICMTFNVCLFWRVFAQNKEFRWAHRSTVLVRTGVVVVVLVWRGY